MRKDTYCLISIITFPIEITPYLGYCWNMSTIFIINNNMANPNIPYPVFLFICLRMRINDAVASDTIDKNNQIGYTALNLFN